MQLIRSCLVLSAGMLAAAASPPDARLIGNEGLVVLARAGYQERFLVELIQSQPGRFDTSVEGLVYLAKQGISEKLVRLVIAEQKALAMREAEQSAAEERAEPHRPLRPAGSGAPAPVRMKMVRRKVWVAAETGAPLPGPPPAIVVEKRLFGDRYYALPGAQAPLSTAGVATPRTSPYQEGARATHVAAFH